MGIRILTNLIAAGKLIGYVLSGLYGVYYVSEIAMENVTLKYEKIQEVKHKKYNDSLETARQLFVEDMAQKYQPNFTLEENAEITERIVNEGIKSLKRYVKNENTKQREDFEVFYMLDENDSTYKMLSYKGADGKYVIIRQIPITQAEFKEANN